MGDKQSRAALLKKLFKDRKRTNILAVPEQYLISFLVKRVPRCLTPNGLTVIGLIGSLLVFIGFVLAGAIDRDYLFMSIGGLVINWFGDSLDGRIAYYRNIPRKWYGFSLDIIMDWFSTVFIGMGYWVYVEDGYEVVGFVFVVLYGWAMIISQLRYKITDHYTIDAGLVGPTEVRVILALVMGIEIIFYHTIPFFAGGMCIVLFIINCKDTGKLLRLGDMRDREERKKKMP